MLATGGSQNSMQGLQTRRGGLRLASALALALGACGKDDAPPSVAGTTGGSGGIALDSDDGMKLDLGGDGTAALTGDGNPDSFTSGCGEVTVVVTPTTPTLVLLVDQSGSMTEDFGGMGRWDAL